MIFFTEIEQKNPKIYMEPQKTLKSKAILRKKNKAVGITLPVFKLYYKTVAIKTAWYCQQNRHTDQWNSVESLEINPHIYGQLIYIKRTKNIQWRKDSVFNKRCWENWTARHKRIKLDHYLTYLTPDTKINSKWIKDLNVRPETIKILDKNIGSTLIHTGLRNIFLDISPQARVRKAKINK